MSEDERRDQHPRIRSALAWIERKNFISVHAGLLYVVTWMTWHITEQAWQYAFDTKLTSGMEAAAVIAAVTVPFAALQAFTFKIYSDSRKPS